MDRTMKIQVEMMLTYSSFFENIFPANEEDAICFPMRNNKYRIRLWPSATTDHTDWWKTPEDSHKYHWFQQVIIELECDSVEEDIVDSLQHDIASPSLEQFYREVADIVNEVADRFIEFLNCVVKQYWVDAFHSTYTNIMPVDMYFI